MPKARSEGAPLTQLEIGDCARSASWFAFEMSTIALLRDHFWDAQHSGSYVDPLQRKPRQFDIQARKAGQRCLGAAAIECKKLSPTKPLLVYCSPRRPGESGCDFVHPEAGRAIRHDTLSLPNAYPPGGMVGRAIDQPSRTADGWSTDDSDTFGRMSQALNSARDLLDWIRSTPLETWAVVIPVLVVPDGTLWTASFGEDGRIMAPPASASRVSLYAGLTWDLAAATGLNPGKYTMSHLEIATESGLIARLEGLARALQAT